MKESIICCCLMVVMATGIVSGGFMSPLSGFGLGGMGMGWGYGLRHPIGGLGMHFSGLGVAHTGFAMPIAPVAPLGIGYGLHYQMPLVYSGLGMMGLGGYNYLGGGGRYMGGRNSNGGYLGFYNDDSFDNLDQLDDYGPLSGLDDWNLDGFDNNIPS